MNSPDTLNMLQPVVAGLHAYIGAKGTNKAIVAFDLDWTLIRTVRGRFPKDEDDWAFLPNRLSSLKAYQDAGNTLVIFTNQGYKGAKLTIAINRINKVIAALTAAGIQPWVFAATGEGSAYRKPNIGMWQVFVQYFPDWDKVSSFYVGDAAGRPTDFSANDRDFAANVRIPFYTPEEIFPQNTVTIPDTRTMFIFVGMPGSGKTTYYQKNLAPKGWIHVNQDTLKTQPKMIKAVRDGLASGKSVAVDATNPSVDKRREYIMLAVEYQIPTMIVYFVGNGYEGNKLRPHPVPDIAYNMYYKNLVEPNPTLDYVPVVELS